MGQASLVDRILAPGALSARFQPVLDLGADLGGWHYLECLIRGPRGTTVESPDVLFDYARRKNREADVDRACVATILEAARDLPAAARLGMNVHASTIADGAFAAFLDRSVKDAGLSAERVVIEVVEHTRPWDTAVFQRALQELRGLGVRIAVDDVGLGEANLLMILSCRPDYLKIDRYFVHGARSDFYRQAVLTSIAQLARPFGARVIAEGVETEADLQAVRTVGIDLVQGYLFGQPCSALDLPHPGGTESGMDERLERPAGPKGRHA
jgi:EAL domain-containing protein (putative c-di-GMP-specific phosphodiesterase class I)